VGCLTGNKPFDFGADPRITIEIQKFLAGFLPPRDMEGKRARGRQRKTFMDWISTACGDKWNINEILKICRDRNEHQLIANVRV